MSQQGGARPTQSGNIYPAQHQLHRADGYSGQGQGNMHRAQDGSIAPEPRPSSRARDRRKQGKDDIAYEMDKRSKEVARQLRENNPDIADLSDANRPTRIAERFSELYDNEWTEAFDALTTGNLKFTEKTAIQLLWDVVEASYSFCEIESKELLNELEMAGMEVLTQGQINDPKRMEGNKHIFFFLKQHAASAEPRLLKKFKEGKKLREILKKYSFGTSVNILDSYIYKCINLCWGMVLQDPPVYMVQPDKDAFEPALYRAYTKTGNQTDFFVWPALKLTKNGSVLYKGVVQYK